VDLTAGRFAGEVGVRTHKGLEILLSALPLSSILLVSGFVRVWRINDIGYNSDEAVYVGQASALAHTPGIGDLFPAFRAHPLLVQFFVSFLQLISPGDLLPRLMSALFGIATVFLVYRVGTVLYSSKAGLASALFMALMPYHVIVSRQILLDGPMTFFATGCLYCLVKFGDTSGKNWFFASAVALGLAMLAKETAIVMIGAIYLFILLAPALKVGIRDLIIHVGILAATIAPFPVAIFLSGKVDGGTDFLTWQLLRRPNHSWDFYIDTVPGVVGIPLLIAAIVALFVLGKRRRWPELLLACWIVVPVGFFQLWQVKGFQYLLPAAPAVALLAGGLIADVWSRRTNLKFANMSHVAFVLTCLIAGPLLVNTIPAIRDASGYKGLAGTGGVPGGREAGTWLAENTPSGATVMTVGPSMANLIQFYGERRALGLAVSPNPLHRNPSYDPILNPDLALRQGDINYIAWDAFSAERSPFFAEALLAYAKKYNGRIIHTVSSKWESKDGTASIRPVIVIYEVRP
jgi:4-amino-4-deoxy-L-arabinose transferase-like glycosyltransferase